MSFTLRVENLKALRRVEWSPEGVCALVGANGAGKSTLLQVLKFLRITAERSIYDSFLQVFGSGSGLRHRMANDAERIRVGISMEGVSWTATLNIHQGALVVPVDEDLEVAGRAIVMPNRRAPDLGLEVIARDGDKEEHLVVLRATSVLEQFAQLKIYHDPALWTLRTQGSPTTHTILHYQSLNAFATLRSWNERREHRHRYEFVVGGLKTAFPGACADLDFESAGQTTFARIWPPGAAFPTSTINEATGVLAMLVYLCNIASGNPGGFVAIDEPENSLHPYAIRMLLESAEMWSRQYDVTIVLATHSPVILDKLSGHPDRVWVMRTDAGDESNPIRLDRLKNPAWLNHFEFGTLYANGEIGSNDDAA